MRHHSNTVRTAAQQEDASVLPNASAVRCQLSYPATHHPGSPGGGPRLTQPDTAVGAGSAAAGAAAGAPAGAARGACWQAVTRGAPASACVKTAATASPVVPATDSVSCSVCATMGQHSDASLPGCSARTHGSSAPSRPVVKAEPTCGQRAAVLLADLKSRRHN